MFKCRLILIIFTPIFGKGSLHFLAHNFCCQSKWPSRPLDYGGQKVPLKENQGLQIISFGKKFDLKNESPT